MTLCFECEENEAVCELTLTDMDSVVLDDTKLCKSCAAHIVEFRKDDSKYGDKGSPLGIRV